MGLSNQRIDDVISRRTDAERHAAVQALLAPYNQFLWEAKPSASTTCHLTRSKLSFSDGDVSSSAKGRALASSKPELPAVDHCDLEE